MKKFAFYSLGALFVLLACTDTVFAGFGITPPYVRNDRLTQGSEFTQEIILVRGDPVDDLKAEITVNVPGINEWFTIEEGTEFLLPKGQSQVPMHVTVRVPDNAAYDRYTGTIRVRTIPIDLSSGVSIALGAQIDVDIKVVDEILDFEVKRVQLSETEEPRRRWWLEFPGKITFVTTLQNTGNGSVAPSRVDFEIYDKRGSVLLEKVSNTNRIDKVEPFETKPVAAYLPTKLPPGAYLVKYNVYLDEDVKRSGELTLSVLPEGTLENYSGYGFMGLSLGDKLSLIVPPVVLLLALIIAIIVVRLIRRSRRKNRRPPTGGSGDYMPPPGGVGGAPRQPIQRRPQPMNSQNYSQTGQQHGVVTLNRRKREE